MKRAWARGWKRFGLLLIHNIGWKLASLTIAVIIWALVASEPELSTFTPVPLVYKNLPDDLEVSGDFVSTVVLELRGPSGELRGVGESVHPSVILDMSQARAGEHTYAIGDGNVKLARGVHLVRAIPSEVRFQFEPRRSRTVPVEVRFAGLGANGYEVSQMQVEPREVQIVGPRSRVARINGVVTDQVDVSNVVGESEFHVNMLVDDPYVRIMGSPEATVRVWMRKQRQEDK
jgi:YbbR domain-containing protein